MTFLENILAGLVVAVLVWGVHRLRTWVARQPLAHPSQKSEPCSLKKHGDLTLNDLPAGPKRELAELLRSLRSESGLTLQAVGDQAQLSKAAVHKILGGRDLANKPNTLRTGSVLALRAVQARPHLDRAGQEKALTLYDQQIRALYTKAVTEDAGPHPAETAALDLWNQIAHGDGRYLPYCLPDDVWDAIPRSRLVTVIFGPPRTVGLFIEAPDYDSLWALSDRGSATDEISWPEEFARSLSRMIDQTVDVLLFCVADFDEEVEAEH